MSITYHNIGEITASVSTLVYFIWFLPQLWLNLKRHNTDGLSLWMHGLLLLGSYADRAQRAIEAGCDVVLVCNNRAGVVDILDHVVIQKDLQRAARIAHYARYV